MPIALTFKDAVSGADLPSLATAPISPLTLALFAGGSGDHNPIHIDGDFARANGFDDVFAHGMLSMAYMGRVLSNWAPQERILAFSARFISITPLRATVTCKGRVADLLSHEGAACAMLALSATLADGTMTVSGEALVRLD